MKIVHISDSHGAKHHTKLTIPDCDVLIHSGDLGGRTSLQELAEFLIWFEMQPARKKIFIAGNHDIVLDKGCVERQTSYVLRMIALQQHEDAIKLIQNYNVKYLCDKDYMFEGVKFYGSPWTPSFHRQHWAFNADRGSEIQQKWNKIPKDIDVLITHGPPYGILDLVEDREKQHPDEDTRVGCKDLLHQLNQRLTKCKLHCFGHIHQNYGLIQLPVSNTRRIMFSNGAVITHNHQQLITTPLVITI